MICLKRNDIHVNTCVEKDNDNNKKKRNKGRIINYRAGVRIHIYSHCWLVAHPLRCIVTHSFAISYELHDSRLELVAHSHTLQRYSLITRPGVKVTVKIYEGLESLDGCTVPLETMGPFARGKTSSLPNAIATNSPRWDETAIAAKTKATESRGELDSAMPQ